MEDYSAGRFPGYADEEQMVFGLTASQAGILFGSLGFIVLTRMVLLGFVIGVVLWFTYTKYKELGQKNIVMQIAYRSGLYVPKSHIFSEPGADSFRE